MPSPDIHHDPDRQRFTAQLPHGEGYLEYTRPDGHTLDLVYTWVPPADRKAGLGEALVRAGLQFAREHHLTPIPTCGFVRRVMQRDPG